MFLLNEVSGKLICSFICKGSRILTYVHYHKIVLEM
jgi:hypothetical protein